MGLGLSKDSSAPTEDPNCIPTGQQQPQPPNPGGRRSSTKASRRRSSGDSTGSQSSQNSDYSGENDDPTTARTSGSGSGSGSGGWDPFHYIKLIQMGYRELVNVIIRPPRADYDLTDLGPQTFDFCGRKIRRLDFLVANNRDQRIHCSLWEPEDYSYAAATASSSAVGSFSDKDKDKEKQKQEGKEENEGENTTTTTTTTAGGCKVPCMIYMHGNSSARVEAIPQLSLCLSLGICLLAFDFAGSGMSDGEYVSLGYYEKDDLEAVISHLRAMDRFTFIGLWGRSMGAATALLHAPRDPTISCLVSDSAFADFNQLADEIIEKGREHGLSAPKFLINWGTSSIRSTVYKKAKFHVRECSPIKSVSASFVPALFIAANGDDFIPPHHSEQLHENYAGDKNIILVDGDHNSRRTNFSYDSVANFLTRYMYLEPSWRLENGFEYYDNPPWIRFGGGPRNLASYYSNAHLSNNRHNPGPEEGSEEYYESLFEIARQQGGLHDEEAINRIAAQLYFEEEVQKANQIQQQQIAEQERRRGKTRVEEGNQQEQQQGEENNSGMTRERQEQVENTVANFFGGNQKKP